MVKNLCVFVAVGHATRHKCDQIQLKANDHKAMRCAANQCKAKHTTHCTVSKPYLQQHAMHCEAMHCKANSRTSMQNTMHHNSMQCETMHSDVQQQSKSMQHTARQRNAKRYNALQSNARQFEAMNSETRETIPFDTLFCLSRACVQIVQNTSQRSM